ncbi:alpha/beta hydrolase [Canibacter zhoujuaniae]|uniref:alpha/beta hydrolase n=1 Tax=Canibacter zhoujuaniae TaxID=2708343 RepID=UPI00142402C9|nr:alpha/beta fold hydrolase [Canibacter zhoujuaniae]
MAIHMEFIPGGSALTVFLHGLMGRGKNLAQTAKSVKDVTSSLLVDQPNHGESEWTNSFNYGEMAQAVVSAVRQHEAFAAHGKFHLVGHSMGGKVAMLIALEYPEIVQSLTVVDISPVSQSDMSEFKHLLGALAELDLLSIKSRADADRALTEAIPNYGTRAFLLQNLQREVDGFKWQPNLQMLLRELSAIGAFDAPAGKQYEGPVLWVAGADSNYIQPRHLPRMQELFPDVVPVTVADAGHWVHSEQPEKFTALLREFITAEH